MFGHMIEIGLLILLAVLLVLVWLRLGSLRRPPDYVAREIIPLSTGGGRVKLPMSAVVTVRSARGPFLPERIMISNGGTDGGAADWIVNDISIDGRSQFLQSGQVPGDMFAINAVDGLIKFDVMQRYSEVVVSVTYVGTKQDGAPFYGSILGSPLTDREAAKRTRRMKRREKAELAAYSRMKINRARAEEVANARIMAEEALS